MDNDGIGDVCDTNEDVDSDGDGILDSQDNCPNEPNADQMDMDNNGVGDVCENNQVPTEVLWSEASSWPNNTVPVAGDVVMIPADKHIILDIDTPALGGLMIHGTLEFMEKDIELITEYISVHGGELRIGTPENPFVNKAILTVNDPDTEFNVMGDMGTRGIILMQGGVLNIHAQTPSIAWTKINEHAPDGSTSLTLAETTTWKAGDEIIVGPTDFFEVDNKKSVTQKISISQINGRNLTLDSPLEAHHWGRLQYATTNGMSLTEENIVPTPQGDFIYGLTPDNPKILDERAPVGNLTRNVVLRSPDDARWQDEGFGAHIMIMPGSAAYVDGLEIQRGGQRGRVRRYPIHWHMLSYLGTETLADATGQFLKNSTINESENRGIVVHGTNGLLIQNNIVYKTKGHAIFTENGAERRTTFDHNLVLHVRSPLDEFLLKQHERRNFRRGSSGFWISHPDNTTINNHVGDISGAGYWLAFPDRPTGDCSEVLHEDGQVMNPRRMVFGVFDNNTAHSCGGSGFHNDDPEMDEEGNRGTNFKNYSSDLSGRDSPWPFTTRRRFDISGLKTWKNELGVWDRANGVNTINTVAADNKEKGFSGSGDGGLIIGALAVGASLNDTMNGYERPYVWPAFASYHHTFDLQGNIAVNFPLTPGKLTGVFSTDDYYLRPVEKGHIISKGNVLINSHPGSKVFAAQAWRESHVSPTNPHFNLAGAILDPEGYWGPANNYYVYDDPFYTYGLTAIPVAPSAAESQGVSVPGKFYGFDNFTINDGTGPYERHYMGLHIVRYNDAFQEVGTLTLAGMGNALSNLLPNMRDFAAHETGIFEINFPEDDAPNRVLIGQITNMETEADKMLVGIELNGAIDATVKITAVHSNGTRLIDNYTALTSLNDVQNSDGETFWQDKANNKVWVKVRGGKGQAADLEDQRDIPYYTFELVVE